MNRCVIIILCILLPAFAASQHFTVSMLQHGDKAYLGFNNPLSCTIEGLSCKSIELSTDNGTITKESSCYYNYRPARIADSKIIINKRTNNKLQKIGEFYVRVREFPAPVAYIGGLQGGEISKGSLRAQQGVSCSSVVPGFELKYSVDSFTVTAYRKDTILHHKQHRGNLFSEETKSFFKSLEPADKVLVHGILYLQPDGKKGKASPIELVIK